MHTHALGPGPEFDLIRAVLAQDARIRSATTSVIHTDSRAAVAGRIVVGAGDDCTIVSGDTLAISMDACIENVHFRREWIAPHQIGYRAGAAALSDLAAAGAVPIGLLVTLAVSPADVPDFALSIMAGISEVAATYGAALIGGDVARTAGPAMIDITVLGEPGPLVTRAGASPGDEVWVTGTLGAAATAVREWNASRQPPEPAIQAFARPVPRIREARWLVERAIVTAMIDLSDGLAGDAAHLASASDVRILLDPDTVPISDIAASVAGETAAIELATGGGEDYELCLTARPGLAELATEFSGRFGVALTRVGHVVDGQGTGFIGGDGPPLRGYSHF